MNKKKKNTKLDSAPDIIQIRKKPSNELEIENLVLIDMRKKILNDEMNQLQFYDIVKPDQDEMITTLKEVTKTPIKLHHKVKRSDLEQRLRNRLAAEPGNRLLLQEIYEKLEEDGNPAMVRKKLHQEEQFKANQQYKAESDEQQVANLDAWYKAVRRKAKEEQERIRKEQEKQREEEERARLAKLQQQQRTKSISNFRRAGLAFRDIVKEARPGTMNLIPAFPKLLAQADDKTYGEDASIKQRLLGSIAKMTIRKKVELLNADSNLTKQLDKYMQQGSTLTTQELQQIEQARAKQDVQEKAEGTLIFDYTVEGLKNSLHTLIKMQITSFQNAVDRAFFYEKQTNQILNSINKKLERQKATVTRNDRDLHELRMENHEIHQKLRDIQNLLKELSEEMKNVNATPKEKPKNPTQSSTQFNPKSNASNIDNYMAIVGKQHEIEDQIELMRDSYIKFQEQMKANSVQVQKLESENSKLNKNNKALLKSIQGFLLELLHIGLDCRKQGLCWIIKAVWDSGEKMSENNFPPYLDSKAREFLLSKTRRILELNDLFKRAHLLFANYQGSSMDTANNSLISLLAKNHFSQIDTHEIKVNRLVEEKQKKRSEMELLLQGLTEGERRYIDQTLTSILTSKATLNDIIYNEASRRIHKMFKSQQEFFSQGNASVPGNNSNQHQNQQQPSIMQEQSIMQFTTEANPDYKERLIKEYQQIQREIEKKEHEFRKFEELELQRLVKEIDYRKYLQRYDDDEALQVLASLFGYQRAERELIKYGMMHKMLNN